ncbi:hypothetical protein M514_08736 [Trichuris suis]|uniref:Uncharacterized protein n=1 Tax=Trichuris suis TaxID=68888 RepID=A0A085N7D3_9BILA|nr:hypothetical protein M514_08736 [Trichuris suis]
MGDAEKQSISNPADPEKKGRRRKKKKAVIIEHVVDEGFDPRPVVLSAERLLTHPDIAKAARRVGKLPHCLKERAKRMGRRYISMYINDDENTTNEITVKIPRYQLAKLNLPMTAPNPLKGKKRIKAHTFIKNTFSRFGTNKRSY